MWSVTTCGGPSFVVGARLVLLEGWMRGWSSETLSMEGLPVSSGRRWYFVWDAIVMILE